MSAARPTLGGALRQARDRLSAAGIAEPEADARLLLGWASGRDALALLLDAGQPLDPDMQDAFERALARRLAREPVGRILGWRDFRGLRFALAPDTLEPRHDSEIVVEAGLAALAPLGRPAPRLLDLGCGSGCLLLALLHELRRDPRHGAPGAWGVGVDISSGAARASRDNASRLGLGDEALIVRGRWAEALAGPFDLIVSNPPYIAAREIDRLDPEVRGHDPRLALDGGADGLDAYRAILPALPALLAPGAAAVLEIGHDQADAVSALARGLGAAKALLHRDLAGRSRALELGWR